MAYGLTFANDKSADIVYYIFSVDFLYPTPNSSLNSSPNPNLYP